MGLHHFMFTYKHSRMLGMLTANNTYCIILLEYFNESQANAPQLTSIPVCQVLLTANNTQCIILFECFNESVASTPQLTSIPRIEHKTKLGSISLVSCNQVTKYSIQGACMYNRGRSSGGLLGLNEPPFFPIYSTYLSEGACPSANLFRAIRFNAHALKQFFRLELRVAIIAGFW